MALVFLRWLLFVVQNERLLNLNALCFVLVVSPFNSLSTSLLYSERYLLVEQPIKNAEKPRKAISASHEMVSDRCQFLA
jgi:hypothetical protein